MRIPYTACPLCDGRAASHERVADCSAHPQWKPELPATITWVRCASCGHVFADGYWSDAALALIFAATLPQHRVGHDYENRRHKAARIVAAVAELTAPSGRAIWLDMGFGDGALLFAAQEFGFEPFGLDARRENVEAMRERGVHAEMATSLDKITGRASVISMADVLEHLAFPKQALLAARRLLKTGGALFLSMPNMDTELWRQWDRDGTNPYWGTLEHLHNFSRGRLVTLLKDCGFEPERYAISERYRSGMEIIASVA